MRSTQRDPEPMVYPFSGQRAALADEALGWVFRPREGYSQNEEDYA